MAHRTILVPQHGTRHRYESYGCCSERGTLGYIRNRKTGEKKHPKLQSRQKIRPKPKTEHRTQNREETDSMVTSGVYRANYTNTYFIKVLVNVMDFSKALASISIFFNHRLCFCRCLKPGLWGLIFQKAAGNGAQVLSRIAILTLVMEKL